jgi:hypothetical protein
MLTKLKLTSTAAFSVAIMSVAMLGSVGSAHAAGCLDGDQSHYSLIEADDNDAALEASATGFGCNADGSALAYTAPVQTAIDPVQFAAEPQQPSAVRAPLDEAPRESLVSNND